MENCLETAGPKLKLKLVQRAIDNGKFLLVAEKKSRKMDSPRSARIDFHDKF